MVIILSPDCKNESLGGACGYCKKCGRDFKYFNRLDGQPILYVITPSPNDLEDIKEECIRNKELKDLAPDFKVEEYKSEE